ncbi:DUF6404 family protein [soil metagenome]
MWRSNYEPPILRLFWRLGIDLPPPHFSSFGITVLFSGGLFGLEMVAFFMLVEDLSWLESIVLAPFAGLIFGVVLAAYYSYGKRKYQLPSWQQLDTP